MEWYNYFSGFFAGMFLSNSVPHFVNGISGNKFPTPFSKPHGKGLSSPTLNVAWSLINLVAGYALFILSKLSSHDILSLVIFFIGFAAMSLFSSIGFSRKDKI
jgi:hypothetical protein